jgi:uncharacterized protein (TIGR02453 family)
VPQFFTKKTLAFLRALKRNNDREWFRARKPDYEQHVRAPMVALLGQLAHDLPAIAPDLVSDPRVCLFRIYRDTRFSDDKRPLKTQVAAHFPSRKFPKGEGAGMYVEITPQWVWMGGGIYMPSAPELQAIRAAIAEGHRTFQRIVTAPAFRAAVGELTGEQLTRVPRGYSKDHAAAGYLRRKQFIGGREYPPEFALSPRFYPELLKVFRGIAPLVSFLNAAILSRGTGERRDEGTSARFYASLSSLVP